MYFMVCDENCGRRVTTAADTLNKNSWSYLPAATGINHGIPRLDYVTSAKLQSANHAA